MGITTTQIRTMNSVILEGDTGFVSGGLQPPLAVGASQVCQRASLLEPPVHTHLDVTVDVPARDSIYYVKCDNNSRFRMLNLVVDRKCSSAICWPHARLDIAPF